MLQKVILGLIFLALTACATQSEVPYVVGEPLLSDSFENPESWSRYDRDGILLEVRSSLYHAEVAGSRYAFSLNLGQPFHTDVIMEVTSMVVKDSGYNGYGVICRADPSFNGEGYYFLIGSDGTYSIRYGRGRDVESLVTWTHSRAINTGEGRNRIRAVCIGDMLSLYVNDQLVDTVYDNHYSRGVAGLAFVSGDEFTVEFDDFEMWEAELK